MRQLYAYRDKVVGGVFIFSCATSTLGTKAKRTADLIDNYKEQHGP
jgi:hypothetical protein